MVAVPAALLLGLRHLMGAAARAARHGPRAGTSGALHRLSARSAAALGAAGLAVAGALIHGVWQSPAPGRRGGAVTRFLATGTPAGADLTGRSPR
ncbi:hypothetical protein [Streptomyces sp. NPDC049040]|uniref:hypothetical protein n=1 Tax=Streptomyces sp. NPDC049040 TaxID=3365593 RepID=UPI00371E9BCD